MKRVYLVFCVVLVSIFSSTTFAETKLLVQQVTSDVYALVGELGNRSAENYGNNATFGVVITNKGVVLIDSGASYKG
ncbi:MAG: hypothetical protein ISR69_15205, partial [Gammaproteobacteria bacterium]|nr:hypothetical protein [Gammaproteobacteria bacterium]